MILVCLGIVSSTLYEQPKARKGEVDVNKVHTGAVAYAAEEEADPPISEQKKGLMAGIVAAILIVQFY
jgi:hypothetical protein